MKKKIIALVFAGVMVLSMIGCGNKEETKATESTEAATESETETEEETFKTIGTEKEADNVFCVKLKNSTGKKITGVSVKTMDDTEFSENMLKEKDVFEVNEERNLFYEAASDENQETESEENTGDEKLLTPGYDIQLTFEDETVKVLHAFPFEDIEEGEICLEDDVAFLKYESLSSKQKVNTKEAELAEKQAETVAETEAVQADEEYVDDNSWDDGGYVDNGYVEPAPAPAPEPAPAPAQGADECLGDDALTY